MIIGLTGGIASGKSLVADLLKQEGLPVIDADQIAKEIVEPHEEAYRDILFHFGREVFHEDGTLHRKALGKVIFNDPKQRETLNNIMHPRIRERSKLKQQQYENEGYTTIVYDIPLLIEGGKMDQYDQVLLVYVDEDVQLQRLMERDQSTEEEAKSRMNSQMPLREKRQYADEIINNNGSIEETTRQVRKTLKKWGI
ncbi:dephospho-CoA kinase [Geomicrobium sp. JCM 19055]|uniref:dephospho-CoA kinase n=1 Tax=Geomicrobium sp. JCM 19055 TaxID=1460649 RepID=UPI00045EDA34|nr:dephospho-CoA kinase [Geomicrobium sp. JCM 19055]GAJ99358.1 dephospho-CoA kinase [Geomicrobium sp. JCM 19055]